MRVATSLPDFAALRADVPRAARVGYVATMGALHEGHVSLIARARALADVVVVSVFVNPLQFGPDEDYARYPRPLAEDLEACERAGVDIVLVPSVAELYPAGRQVTVSAGAIGSTLEGAFRPGHFDGVLTVVLKFFHLIAPHVTVFGAKDAQQLAVISRMATDLNLDLEVVGAPIVREPDGLAMSSRNVFLSPNERTLALSLSAALQRAAAESTVPAARIAADEVLDRAGFEPNFRLDYACFVDPSTFLEVPEDHVGAALFVLAARVGGTRLIDNATVVFSGPGGAGSAGADGLGDTVWGGDMSDAREDPGGDVRESAAGAGAARGMAGSGGPAATTR